MGTSPGAIDSTIADETSDSIGLQVRAKRPPCCQACWFAIARCRTKDTSGEYGLAMAGRPVKIHMQK